MSNYEFVILYWVGNWGLYLIHFKQEHPGHWGQGWLDLVDDSDNHRGCAAPGGCEEPQIPKEKEHFKNFNNHLLSKVTSNQSSCYLPLCFLYPLIIVFENEVGKGAVYMDHLVFSVFLLNSGRLNYCRPSTVRMLTFLWLPPVFLGFDKRKMIHVLILCVPGNQVPASSPFTSGLEEKSLLVKYELWH